MDRALEGLAAAMMQSRNLQDVYNGGWLGRRSKQEWQRQQQSLLWTLHGGCSQPVAHGSCEAACNNVWVNQAA
jgi:hypothetical protein